MSKKTRAHNVSRVEDGSDKPDFAADLFRPERKPKEKPKAAPEDTVTVGDRLGKGLSDQLAKLKAEMEASVAAKTAPGKDKSTANRKPLSNLKKTGSHGRPDPDDNLSFAELFDPEESEDESSFSELLDESKLDWRKFKS